MVLLKSTPQWQTETVVQRCSLKSALKNLAKFTEKHLCHSLFSNKVAGLGLQLY